MSTMSREGGPKTVTITFKVKYLWLVLGVLLALLAVTPIVASYYPAPPPSTPTGPSGATPNCSNPCTIVIQNSQFGTGASVIVKVGTQVIWKNSDSTDHTSTSDVGVSPAWNTGILVPGQSSAPITFSTPGTFTYHCNIHPMVGEIVVVS
jgi:plastocyanin